MKRIGLKYCGGCNPSYERVEYVREIQESAGALVEWVPPDEGGFNTLLVVCGCDKQCVEMAEYEETGRRVIYIKDKQKTPKEILSLILREGDTP